MLLLRTIVTNKQEETSSEADANSDNPLRAGMRLEAWKKPALDFPNYEAGSWGPRAAFELIERDGRQWRKL